MPASTVYSTALSQDPPLAFLLMTRYTEALLTIHYIGGILPLDFSLLLFIVALTAAGVAGEQSVARLRVPYMQRTCSLIFSRSLAASVPGGYSHLTFKVIPQRFTSGPQSRLAYLAIALLPSCVVTSPSEPLSSTGYRSNPSQSICRLDEDRRHRTSHLCMPNAPHFKRVVSASPPLFQDLPFLLKEQHWRMAFSVTPTSSARSLRLVYSDPTRLPHPRGALLQASVRYCKYTPTLRPLEVTSTVGLSVWGYVQTPTSLWKGSDRRFPQQRPLTPPV
ncbi:hypothetical protein Tco_0908173 [Tanacetum coccineum]|uniref:Uncharacterized protein n=1 Tax=Tanacetum coccineum TaxID=301880 RepID=A0ABQ5CPM0_9ASTR